MTTTESPLTLHREVILPEWIDYNGHMNVAYYVLAFDHATDAFIDHIGMDEPYRERTLCSTYVLEAHVTYEEELTVQDPIRCTTQLLGFDQKRVHYFHEMYHDDKDFLAATNELILIHMDMTRRRSSPLPPATLEILTAIQAEHSKLPRPPQAGRVIGLHAKRPV